jgi:ABC-2 type transport system ATP-binding protein
VRARGLSKTFRIPLHRPSTLKERALHPFRRIPVRELRALDEVSFEVGKGEAFGIAGANGSGKSTLLKVLAGIYRPNGGAVRVDGRLSPFIELGVGFNEELAARDNVLINCTLLGLSRAEARRRFDAIIEFAELEDFVDLKLKNYSSGMQVRLAFSTAIQVDADVILLDEVLAVGDAAFQQKCFDVLNRLKAEGRTLILVTHAMETVLRFCDRAMLLESGAITKIGSPGAVVRRYREVGAEALAPFQGSGERLGDRRAEIASAWFEDSSGERINSCEQGERLSFLAHVVFHGDMEEPTLGVQFHDERGTVVFAASSGWIDGPRPSFKAGDQARLRVSFDNVLAVGRHFASPSVNHRDVTLIADYRAALASVVVTGPRWTPGTVDLPHEVEVEPL